MATASLTTGLRACVFIMCDSFVSFSGNKKFFMGDEPSEIDCALFGALAQVKWHFAPNIYTQLLKGIVFFIYRTVMALFR